MFIFWYKKLLDERTYTQNIQLQNKILLHIKNKKFVLLILYIHILRHNMLIAFNFYEIIIIRN